MKKPFLLLLLSLGLASISYGGYLDNWTDNELCGWMDNPLPPAHIIAKVNMREVFIVMVVLLSKQLKRQLPKNQF